ncbi:M23 family metallopeptidase [Solirubrobacter sp. CPCC 204708]|uniref:M23 family metallopeptidase n=1 Tax=Solirubrobacter deserti TaxID=2282478 RepID=A0ABT4RHZ2_9ACTN|nr:M23 family metallopeptidase [Solirubrobacter deserti]MBE2318789.1 M23 family metallopeptidase [Solirubrobacter deserti]MDA0138169.1 M23 family metallopeptidase [Solirubrobacter deserti]
MPVRTLAALVLVVLVAGFVVASAPAQSSGKATATAAVITGDLGRVTRVRASGEDSASSSLSAETPEGIVLGDGFVSVVTSVSEGSAEATAEANDLELFGGLVTVAFVQRKAVTTGGRVKYSGLVSGLTIGDEEYDEVKGTKTFQFEQGVVTANQGGAGLIVELTSEVDGIPAGTEVVVADVSASVSGAGGGSATPDPDPDPTATPTAEPTAEPERTATPTPTPRPRNRQSWRERLMSKRFVFPVGGRATIGGPFGAPRASTGRPHAGNDIFADFGTPVVAVADGELANVGTLPISGNRLWVYADSGDQFFYAHLSAFSANAVNRRRVEAGEVLGYVGNTGDAEPTPPHVHFEIHPNGGDAVDPNPFLVAWQKRAGSASRPDTAERPGTLVEVRDFIEEQ